MHPIVIASTLNDTQNDRLAAHPAQPVIVPLGLRAPWDPPVEAQALFTYQTQWRGAPREAPATWPGGLRWLQIASAGVDTFPRWIHAVPLVTRGVGVQATAMAEYVVAAVLAHEKRFTQPGVAGPGAWRARPLGAIAGKRLGIAGLGAIGSEIARLARPLGLEVGAVRRGEGPAPPGVTMFGSLREIAGWANHLVLAMPLTDETRGAIDDEVLGQAHPGLHLINVSRGALIDDDALLRALDAGRVGAATLDVTSPEPLPEGHAFYSHPAIRLTPHESGAVEDGEERLARRLRANLDAYLAGATPEGVVDPVRGY
jgi:phosphoglycerate dehydrogenase-like enzyme